MAEIERPQHGAAYVVGGNISSLVLPGETIRSAAGFGSVERAEEALECWRRMDLKGSPASSTSFFRAVWDAMKRRRMITYQIKASDNNMLAKHFSPAWIEARGKGAYKKPHYHYDINKAFYWAGVSQVMPSRFSWYRPGDTDYIALMRDPRPTLRAVPPQMERSFALVTSADVRHYGLRGEIVGGLTMGPRTVDLGEAIDQLAHLPDWLFKRVTQSYWGMFAQRQPVERRTYEGGEIVKRARMWNRYQNIPYAVLITHRVARRVSGALGERGLICYVDSVLVPERMPISQAPGDWKRVGTFENGVYVRAAGVWTDLADVGRRVQLHKWHRHAGYNDPEMVV